jgi:hypothetical protein
MTPKFNKEMVGKGIESVSLSTSLVGKKNSPKDLSIPGSTTDWTGQYIRFIQEAEVPQRGEGGSGSYDLNKFSEKAAKQFRKMIEKEGVQYPVLIKSTLLYYKTHRRYPVTITRYIEEGLWRTDYMALLESVKEGKLTDHIQNEIDHEKEFSKYRLG